MRKALCQALVSQPRAREFVFLTGDLGFKALEPLRDALGSRFINAGVAEQNMVSVAAGLAAPDLRPWVYSIAPFIYARPFEQIRNDVCLHALPVVFVGNGGGYGYGVMGSTHHALEDYGILLSLCRTAGSHPGVRRRSARRHRPIVHDARPRLSSTGFERRTAAMVASPLCRLAQARRRKRRARSWPSGRWPAPIWQPLRDLPGRLPAEPLVSVRTAVGRTASRIPRRHRVAATRCAWLKSMSRREASDRC